MAGRGDNEGYEWALARIPELEVELAAAFSGLERAQSDNAALRDIHTNLVNAYRRLQHQHDRLTEQLHDAQDEAKHRDSEHQKQRSHYKSMMDAKTRECEELAQRAPAPRDLEALKRQLSSKIEEPLQQKIRNLESRLSQEQRRFSELQRQVHAAHSEALQEKKDLQDEITELTKAGQIKDQMLERKTSSLQAETRRLEESESTVAQLKEQLRDLEAKYQTSQRALQEQEVMSNREKSAMAEQLRVKVEETSTARRQALDLESQLEQEKHKNSQLNTALEASRGEVARLQQEVHEAHLKTKAAELREAPELLLAQQEVAQLKSKMQNEKEQHLAAIKVLEERINVADVATRRSDARIKQIEEEHKEQMQLLQEEHDQARNQLANENLALRAQLDAAERESEARKQNWREREAALVRQVEAAANRVEAVSDELLQCQVTQNEFERRIQEQRERELAMQAAHQQQGDELASLSEKVERLKRERGEAQATADGLRAKLATEEQKCQKLEAQAADTSKRLNDERIAWAKETAEVEKSASKAEEERRSAAQQRLTEDHKRQLQKLSVAAKKALQKEKLRRQEFRTKCQELAKRIAQLQAEKAMVVRVCQENKNAYELRMAELSVAVGVVPRVGLAADFPMPPPALLRASETSAAGGAAHRRELRAISERLERHAEWLQRRSNEGEDVVPLSASA